MGILKLISLLYLAGFVTTLIVLPFFIYSYVVREEIKRDIQCGPINTLINVIINTVLNSLVWPITLLLMIKGGFNGKN